MNMQLIRLNIICYTMISVAMSGKSYVFHISPIFFPYLAICSSYFFHLFFCNSNVFFSNLPYLSIFFVGKSYVFPDLSQIFPKFSIFFHISRSFPDFFNFFHIFPYRSAGLSARLVTVPGQPKEPFLALPIDQICAITARDSQDSDGSALGCHPSILKSML